MTSEQVSEQRLEGGEWAMWEVHSRLRTSWCVGPSGVLKNKEAGADEGAGCGGQLSRWLPVTSASWDSCFSIIHCPWVWAGPSDLLPTDIIQQNWWAVISGHSLPKDSAFCLARLLLLSHLCAPGMLWASCLMERPAQHRRPRGLRPIASEQLRPSGP